MRDTIYASWLDGQPVNANTAAMRQRALLRVEREYGCDLDEEYDRDGLAELLGGFQYSTEDAARGRDNPTRMNIRNGDIRNQVMWYRTQINSYRKFREAEELGFEASDDETAEDISDEAQTFGLEADLEAALRGALSQLEPGLELADGGTQRKVASGFIDILARDRNGVLVVIELKAGMTRPAAVAQVLGYMADIADTEGGEVRGYLIGADHHARVEAAARAVPALELRRYAYQFTFN